MNILKIFFVTIILFLASGIAFVPETFLSFSELDKSIENKAVPVAQLDRATSVFMCVCPRKVQSETRKFVST